MSFIYQEEYEYLNDKTEYIDLIDSNKLTESEEYIKMRKAITKKIMNHFNNRKANKQQNLKIDTTNLYEYDKICLEMTLSDKGYTVIVDQNHILISS